MLTAGLFVDVQNLMGMGRLLHVAQINYRILKEYFESRYQLIRSAAYTCSDASNERQQKFLNCIAAMGYRIVEKPIKHFHSGKVKANCDMEMAFEIYTTAARLEVIILVTGDSDFAILVDYLAKMGKRVIVVCSDKVSSVELFRSCDERIRLEDIPNITKELPELEGDAAVETTPPPKFSSPQELPV